VERELVGVHCGGICGLLYMYGEVGHLVCVMVVRGVEIVFCCLVVVMDFCFIV
jgi:hypothetical protein